MSQRVVKLVRRYARLLPEEMREKWFKNLLREYHALDDKKARTRAQKMMRAKTGRGRA